MSHLLQEKVVESHHSARVLGPFRGWGPVFADIGTSVYYVPGILSLNPLIGSLAGFFVFLVNIPLLLLSINYAEVTHRYRHGGGVVTTATEGIGQWYGTLGGWFILVDYFLTIAISALSGVLYFTVLVPAVGPIAVWVTIGVILVLGILNWWGIKESANVATAGAVLAFLSDLAIIGTVLTHNDIGEIVGMIPQMFDGHTLSPQLIVIGVAQSFLAFSGLESISQLSPALKDPLKKTGSRAIKLVFGSFVLTSTPLTFLSTMILRKASADPVQSAQLISLLAGNWPKEWWSVCLQFETSLSATLLLLFASITGIIGAYHVILALSSQGKLPKVVERRNRLRGTPHIAILIVVVVPVVLLAVIGVFIGVEKALDFLGSLYAFGLLGAFTLTCWGLSNVRIKERRLALRTSSDEQFETQIRCLYHTQDGDCIPYTRQEVLGMLYEVKIWLGWVALALVLLAFSVNLIEKPMALVFGGMISLIGMLFSASYYYGNNRDEFVLMWDKSALMFDRLHIPMLPFLIRLYVENRHLPGAHVVAWFVRTVVYWSARNRIVIVGEKIIPVADRMMTSLPDVSNGNSNHTHYGSTGVNNSLYSQTIRLEARQCLRTRRRSVSNHIYH